MTSAYMSAAFSLEQSPLPYYITLLGLGKNDLTKIQ